MSIANESLRITGQTYRDSVTCETCPPSQSNPWTLSAADFHAKTSATPENVRESAMEHEVAFGQNSHESLAFYDHATCSWKTSQRSLFGGLIEFSGPWPKSGLMRNGSAYQAETSVRRICENCKRPVQYEPELLIESALNPALAEAHVFYEGAGCMECGGTGFKGRMAICELLDLTDHIREIILDKRPISEVKRAAKEQGMRFLRESAVERVMHGLTTLREINKVTFVE